MKKDILERKLNDVLERLDKVEGDLFGETPSFIQLSNAEYCGLENEYKGIRSIIKNKSECEECRVYLDLSDRVTKNGKSLCKNCVVVWNILEYLNLEVEKKPFENEKLILVSKDKPIQTGRTLNYLVDENGESHPLADEYGSKKYSAPKDIHIHTRAVKDDRGLKFTVYCTKCDWEMVYEEEL